MSITIGGKPDSDFNDPLGLMTDCHRRIEKFLDRLLALAESVRGGTLEEDQREALDRALRYFRTGAPLHTADEEESLFPRLRAAGEATALDALADLEKDHRGAELAHEEVDRIGRQWIADGGLSPADSDRLTQLLRELRETYRRHIAFEDLALFPAAARALKQADISQIGQEMALRRGLDPDNLPSVNRCAQLRIARSL